MVKFMKNIMKTKQLIWVALVALLLFSCSQKKPESTEKKTAFTPDSVRVVSGYGRVGAFNDITDITSEVGGVVEKLFVEEGDTLVAGDTILSLKHDKALLDKNQTLADLQVIQSEMNVLDNQIETEKKTVQNKSDYLKRIQNSYQSGTESKQAVDNARLDYEQTAGQLEELKLQKITKQKQYNAKREQLQLQKLTLDQHFIKSPGDGVVLSLETDVNKPVQPLQSVGEFRFAGPYAVNAEIDELFSRKVKKGMKVEMVPYGQSDTTAVGTITFVAPQLSQKSMFSDENNGFMDRRVRKIKVRIDSSTEDILTGQRVNVYVDVK